MTAHGPGRIVRAAGVFDPLGVAELAFLAQARRDGDTLEALVVHDDDVRSLFGVEPLAPASDRAQLVAALWTVDRVRVARAQELTTPGLRVEPGLAAVLATRPQPRIPDSRQAPDDDAREV